MKTEPEQRRKPDNFWRLMGYVKPYWLAFAGATLCGLVKFSLPLLVPLLAGKAVNVLVAADRGALSISAAWPQVVHLSLTALAVVAAGALPTYLRSMIGARAVQMVIRNLRCDLYAHIQKLSHSFFDTHRSGSLTSRIIGDVEAIQPFLNQGLIQGWMNVYQISIVLIIFLTKNLYLTLLAVALLPLHILIQRKISWKIKANSREIRDQLAGLAGSTQERLAAATVVKAFTREEDEIQRFSEGADTLIDMGIRNSALNGFSQACVTVLNHGGQTLVMLAGSYLAFFHPQMLSIGDLVTFVMMVNRLYEPFERLNEMQLTTANALGATDRIFEIFDTEPEVADRPGAVRAPHFRGEIHFQDVVFSYPGSLRPTMNGFTLQVPAHSTLALVGPSGGGKTTITNLLNRFYHWEAGSITIDGRDIRDYTVYSLRNQLGLVPQDPILFSGTIEENILYGRPDASSEEVREAAQRAYAADFIEGLDEGYETLLGERGLRLSGGQKQRIAIARAFLKDPAILILDEATSALDSESERYVQQALEDLMQGRTTIIIAHRLATIRHADQIAVIEDGHLAECGTHDALLQHGGLYATLCQQQFGVGVTDIAVVEN